MIKALKIDLYSLLADAPRSDITLNQPPPPSQSDPMVDQGGELTVYIGIFLLIIGIAAIVGIFSRRVEHALMTALGLSIIPIAFFLFSRH
ncbi:MAG: hypothetical protein WCA35_09640 [Kovacikia sp.]